MGSISLQIPQVGQPNSTEEPKIATDLTTIQAVINGNIDPTNLSTASKQSSVQLAGSTIAIRASCGIIDGVAGSTHWAGTNDWTVTFGGVGDYTVHNAAWPSSLCPIMTCSESGSGAHADVNSSSAGSFSVSVFRHSDGSAVDAFVYFAVLY